MGTRDELKRLMARHGLDAEGVADLLCVKVSTVHAWLSVGQTRPIPDRQLALLRRLVSGKQ